MAFNFGNNLVGIAALTTLVGATTAESLILGSRGAAGLPWAAMSLFGSFYLVKACIAASMPGWLREALGVNSPLCCEILGVSSTMDNKTMLKVARSSPVGISIRLSHGNKHVRPSIDCVYAFDEYTSGIVRSCPSFQHGNAPRVYAYARDGPQGDTTRDWLAIAATVPKLVEAAVLWQYTSWQLSVTSTISWAFFFLAAVMLQVLGMSREFRNVASDSQLNDIFAGDFPTIQGPGKELKIILGVPINVRRHFTWLLMWGFGCIVCLSSTIATYILLSAQSTEQFYIWAFFQCSWLILRSVFYHFAVITDGRPYPVVEQKVTDQRYRLLSLAAGVSRHLAQLHPRTSESYFQDLHDPFDIQSYVHAAKCRLDWKVGVWEEQSFDNAQSASSNIRDSVDIDVLAVVGDTMLASIAWIHGSNISGLDLYDSCLVIFKINKETFLVPAARVLSGNVSQVKLPPADAEAGAAPVFIPKLGPCRGEENGWVYWIPLDSDRWLYIICGLDSLGEQRAEVLHSAEVTRRLMLGNLWVSLTNVDEVKAFVEKSAAWGHILINDFLLEEKST